MILFMELVSMTRQLTALDHRSRAVSTPPEYYASFKCDTTVLKTVPDFIFRLLGVKWQRSNVAYLSEKTIKP